MITERMLPVGNVQLRVLEAGFPQDTSAFVLVHGLGATATKWRDVLPQLARVRRTLAVDLPGHGYSDSPAGPYSMPWFAGAVRATMDAAGIDRAVVIGNSMGGLVAMHLAAAEPRRVDALVMVSPALPLVTRPQREHALAFVAPMLPYVGPRLYLRHVGSRTVERLVEEGLARNVADPSAVNEETRAALIEETRANAAKPERARILQLTTRALGWAMSAGRERTWDVARGIRVPTLVLWGDRDQLIGVANGQEAVARIPGSQLVVLDGLGHNPFLEAPERFARSVLTFIGESPRIEVHGVE
jgi:pimeloyl-ACP methyl ester carboxylesterase